MEQEEREKRELEKRERELKDFEFKSRMQAAMSEAARPPIFDPQWMELQRRFGGGGPGSAPGSSSSSSNPPGTPSSSLVPPFGMFPPPPGSDGRDRLGLPPGGASETMHNLAAAERLQAERIAAMDPIMRLQMANLASELQAHTHAHTHAHGEFCPSFGD